MRTKLKFQTELKNIYSLFKDNSFSIPTYQRQYSWDTEQWEALWQDLEQYKNLDSDEHFLGPLIVTPNESGEADFEVIDGQQRLTTLQVVISLIRDSWILRGDKASLQNGIEVPNKALASDLIHSLTPYVRYNFIPNRYLKDIFRDFIQVDINQSSRKSFADLTLFKSCKHADQAAELRRSWLYFQERIENLTDEELKKLENFILFKVLVLTIEAGESSNAYILFETLNYRGLELTQADLVKSYLFSKVFEEEEDETYVTLWDEIESLLGNQSLDTFLRHYLLLTTEKVLKKDIYGEIRNRLQTREKAISFINELRKNAHLYSYLVRETDFNGPHKEVLNHLFNDLSKLGVDTQYVYLLAIMNNYFVSDSSLDYKIIESAARLSEVLSFRWTICGRNAQDLEGIYQKASVLVGWGQSSQSNFKEAQLLLQTSLPSDEEFASAFRTKVIKSNQRGHYILRKIDQWHNREGAYVLMGPSELQLEHVAPRKPTLSSGWKKKLGEAAYSDLVSRIGNMILLKKKPNREGSNKSFKDKLIIYKDNNNGKYPLLSQEVFSWTEWTAETIEQRSENIAQLAIEVWSSEVTEIKGKSRPRKQRKKLVKRRVNTSLITIKNQAAKKRTRKKISKKKRSGRRNVAPK